MSSKAITHRSLFPRTGTICYNFCVDVHFSYSINTSSSHLDMRSEQLFSWKRKHAHSDLVYLGDSRPYCRITDSLTCDEYERIVSSLMSVDVVCLRKAGCFTVDGPHGASNLLQRQKVCVYQTTRKGLVTNRGEQDSSPNLHMGDILDKCPIAENHFTSCLLHMI